MPEIDSVSKKQARPNFVELALRIYALDRGIAERAAPAALAKELGISPRTMQHWRTTGRAGLRQEAIVLARMTAIPLEKLVDYERPES